VQFVVQGLVGPLQEASERDPITTRSRNKLFQFIEHPKGNLHKQPTGSPEIPQNTVAQA